jgi:hypothetical protein
LVECGKPKNATDIPASISVRVKIAIGFFLILIGEATPPLFEFLS